MTWDRARQAARSGGTRGLGGAATHLLRQSTAVAPFEHDDLIQSAGTDVDASERTASVFYDRPYAVRQHEDLGERHDPGRQGKYLEQPLHDEAEVLVELIADGIRRELD